MADGDDGLAGLLFDGTVSTSSTTPTPVLTLEKLEEIQRSIPPDPIAEWMKSKGFDPVKGCMLLVCPQLYREMAKPVGMFSSGLAPDYVEEHPYITGAVMVNAEAGKAIRAARAANRRAIAESAGK